MALELITGGCEDLYFCAKRFLLGPYRVRRTRFYCVGASKSGTHSIAEMFSKNVRARHEAEFSDVIDHVIDWREGRLTEEQMIEWLRRRDRELALEVDSTGMNNEFLDLLLREFPDARYLLTIRDCYSWLNSVINHRLRFQGKGSPAWMKWWQWRAGFESGMHAPEEQVLKDIGVPTLDAHLSQWASRNSDVLVKVPASQLLIIRTDQISQRAFDIADFARLPRRAVRLDRTHSFANPTKQEIIRKVDRAFLEQKVQHHCLPLMTRFFPEIKSLDDATL
jgi:Sulfotransferase domain